MPFIDLTLPPDPPQRTDDPDTFAERADAFVVWMAQFGEDLDTFIGQLETAAALIAAAPAYADPGLVALSGLTPAADRVPYFSGSGTSALATFTAAARALLDDANSGAMLDTLGLSANGKSLVTAADYAAMRTLLSIYTAAQTDTAIANATAAAVPAGTVIAVAMGSAPTGYLKADGSAVSRTTYAALFAAISTTYGVGDGSTTFNLPDLRGEFVRGLDDGRGIDTGRTLGSAQADELEAHSHMVANSGTGSGGTSGALARSTSTGGDTEYVLQGIGGTPNVYPTSDTGGTETRPRNVALLYCIKT